jgi:hypothetical protein
MKKLQAENLLDFSRTVLYYVAMKKKSVSNFIRLDPETQRKLEYIAKQEENDKSGIGRLFIKRGIEAYEKEHGKIK